MARFLIIFGYVVCIGILAFSCKENIVNDELPQEELQDTLRFAASGFSLPTLSPKAENIVKDWPIFQEFEQEIEQLQNERLEALTLRSERLLTQTDSLTKTVPDTLNSMAINSRLKVIKTRIQMLIQESKKGKIDPTRIENEVMETRKAVSHLWFQINEKVEKDQIDEQQKEDEEKELEKQRKARDSIFELELQDQ